MSFEQTLESVHNHLIENYQVTKKGRKLAIGRYFFTEKDFPEFAHKIKDDTLLDLLDKLKRRDEPDFFDNLWHDLISPERSGTMCRGAVAGIEGIPMDRYTLIWTTDGKMYTYDLKENRVIHDINPQALADKIKYSELVDLRINSPLYIAEYNPNTLESVYTGDNLGFPTQIINTCSFPHWYYNRDFTPVKEIPPIPRAILNVMTDGSTTQINNICTWLSHSLHKKAQCAMLLLGAKGIGKKMLADIMRFIIGTQNFQLAPATLFTKEFNTSLIDKRIVLCDEVALNTYEAQEYFKLYMNDDLNPEGKRENANKTIKLHVNFLMSANLKFRIFIERDDRRFFIPELTEKSMINQRGADWTTNVGRMIETLNTPSNADEKLFKKVAAQCEQFYYFLKNFQPTFDLVQVPKGPAFNEMVLLSLAPWQKSLRQAIFSRRDWRYLWTSDSIWGEGVRVSKGDRGAKPDTPERIRYWLKQWEEEDGKRIGTLVSLPANTGDLEKTKEYIVPAPRFLTKAQRQAQYKFLAEWKEKRRTLKEEE